MLSILHHYHKNQICRVYDLLLEKLTRNFNFGATFRMENPNLILMIMVIMMIMMIHNDIIILNQVNNNNIIVIFDEYNIISPIKHEVNKEYLFWKTGKDYNTDFSCNNNHNQDLDNCYDDHYRVHSELMGNNPSKIPNNGQKTVLPSSVSRVVKDDAVMKDNEDSREELDIYQKEIDEINSIYTAILKKEYEKSTEVISEEESVNSDVADFETPVSHQDEEYHSAVNENTDSF